jgi:transglutaminase-like putative cysteine protease
MICDLSKLEMKVEIQAQIKNTSNSRIQRARMLWHLFTEMDNQKVLSTNVSPVAKIIEKKDNNTVAILKIPDLRPGDVFAPNATLDIETKTHKWNESIGIDNNLFQSNCEMYCSSKKFWEVNDPLIVKLAKSVSNQTNDDIAFVIIAIREIRKRIKLKSHLNERLGAAKVLTFKEGDCDEHTDLLVALTRARGIPSRRIVGYYLKKQKPEPHAWAEVFLINKGWVPVDPALRRFGILTENYYSRVREGLVSERPMIQVRWRNMGRQSITVEEEVQIFK